MKNILIILVAGLALGGIGYWGFTVYGQIEGVQVSGHGYAAMAIGLVMTLVVGVGLMALLFFSNKHGHDEAVHHWHGNTESDDDEQKD
ncbi:MAG: hypothetical protein EP335_05300 [Alphaproteobacteria bacterium]|nr:MAG: hypothetical protein EP335_05300 [Alphaproteobacteria bacterium]